LGRGEGELFLQLNRSGLEVDFKAIQSNSKQFKAKLFTPGSESKIKIQKFPTPDLPIARGSLGHQVPITPHSSSRDAGFLEL
jgi:hypothetical protein